MAKVDYLKLKGKAEKLAKDSKNEGIRLLAEIATNLCERARQEDYDRSSIGQMRKQPPMR